MALRSLSLCAGIGGIDLGLAEWSRSVCYLEREAFAASVLVARMEDAALDRAPVWSDLRTFDARAWRGSVDLVTGGYPCQPFSFAGKRLGDEDERHLWPEVRRILHDSGAPLAFLENVAGHVSLGLSDVLADLAALGFDAEWCVLRASDVGAPHRRERLFILAYSNVRGLGIDRLRSVLDGERAALGDDADGRDARLGEVERRQPQEFEVLGAARASGAPARAESVPEADGGQGRDRLGDSDRSRRTPPRSGPALDAEREPLAGCGGMGDALLGHEPQEHSRADAEHGERSPVRGGAVVEPRTRSAGRTPRGARAAGDRALTRDDGAVGDAYRLEERRPVAIAGAFPAAWPPGPSDRGGWARWVAAGGPQPVLRRGADGIPAFVDRADRLRALGNAVVPAQARAAFLELSRRAMSR